MIGAGQFDGFGAGRIRANRGCGGGGGRPFWGTSGAHGGDNGRILPDLLGFGVDSESIGRVIIVLFSVNNFRAGGGVLKRAGGDGDYALGLREILRNGGFGVGLVVVVVKQDQGRAVQTPIRTARGEVVLHSLIAARFLKLKNLKNGGNTVLRLSVRWGGWVMRVLYAAPVGAQSRWICRRCRDKDHRLPLPLTVVVPGQGRHSLCRSPFPTRADSPLPLSAFTGGGGRHSLCRPLRLAGGSSPSLISRHE